MKEHLFHRPKDNPWTRLTRKVTDEEKRLQQGTTIRAIPTRDRRQNYEGGHKVHPLQQDNYSIVRIREKPVRSKTERTSLDRLRSTNLPPFETMPL